jgi:polysaccharide biosynthesis protein PelE
VKQRKTSYLAVAAAVFLLESALMGIAVTRHLGPAAAVTAHLMIAATLIAWTISSSECRNDLRIPMLLTVTTAFMSAIGAAGTFVTIMLMSYYAEAPASFEDSYRGSPPESQTRTAAELRQRIIDGQGGLDKSSVAPFSDILFFGTLSQKQELISLMSRNFQPVFAPILRMALNDANNAIRVQAASAITLIEDDFLRRSLSLASSVRDNPSDPALLLNLARLNEEYSKTGILDRDRERDSRNKALEAYREYLQLNPRDLEARAAIGSLLLLDEKYDEALLWSAEAVNDGKASVELVLIYMESLYHRRRFQELRNLAAKYSVLAENDRVSPEAVETLKLWANPA